MPIHNKQMNDNVPVPFQQSSKEEKKIESSLDRRLQLNPAIKARDVLEVLDINDKFPRNLKD